MSAACGFDLFYHNDAIDENLCIPIGVISRCSQCGAELEPWVRGYTFEDQKILFLELGVGRMTPMFIQKPFWNLTYALPQAFYITVNPKDARLPQELSGKGLAIKEEIAVVLRDAVELISGGKSDNERRYEN